MTALLLAVANLILPVVDLPGLKALPVALPYFLDLRAGEGGTPAIEVHRHVKKMTIGFNIERDMNGESVYREVIVEIEFLRPATVKLRELEGLKAYQADGRELTPEAAIRRIGSGCVVLASSDGRKLDAAVAKLFQGDVIVLCSPDLVPKFDEESREIVFALPAVAKVKRSP